MIKLSIIIPCYNAEPYIYELLHTLAPQITKEVEVILIDDGSDKPIEYKMKGLKIYRQKNGGSSKARNKGLEKAKGKVIAFIDADDLVSENYVEYILSQIDEDWDYMDLSWKSLEDNKFTYKLLNDRDSLPNPSACTRVFKKAFIGDVRFPEKKDACEDEHFTRHLQLKRAKHICATEYMYFYRIGVPESSSKRFLNRETHTMRIGYYIPFVTREMTDLVEEIKKEDEEHEIVLMTNKNEIPELEIYSRVICPPQVNRVMEVRGDYTNLFKIIPRPIRTQVAIYTSQIDEISGITTFIYNFCKKMSKYYDITVLYDVIDPKQILRLSDICQVVKNDLEIPVFCDTLICNKIADRIPGNIRFKQSIQMVHCIKQRDWKLPKDRDIMVNVSEASLNSWKDETKKECKVIHNLTYFEKVPKALTLVSAMRVGAYDKQGNDERCIEFAKMLNNADIKYIWLYFSNKPLPNAPENMIHCGSRTDIKPFIHMADYYVCLSGVEAYSYSLLEALELHTPVIVTPLAMNEEMGIKDGENAYIVPFEVEEFDISKILKVPSFNFTYDNESIVKQWRDLLGHTTPTRSYQPKKTVDVVVKIEYRDLQLDEVLKIGEKRTMRYARALELQEKGFVRIIK